jgi:phosphate transport system protein
MNQRPHTDQEFEHELGLLREKLLLMGAKVETMVADSVRAFQEKDPDLARKTIEFDHEINRMEVNIDGFCLSMLARRQPVASDLRFITTALKLVTDLERIGDLAVNICERVIGLTADPPRMNWPKILTMAEAVQNMIRDVLDAFVASDASKAQWIIERDRYVDALYAQTFHEVLIVMMDDRSAVQRGMAVQSIAKYLERMGDHATNLAEMVIFLAKGRDIRHQKSYGDDQRVHPRSILFLCRDNSVFGQMAEGWARKLLPATVRVWSAGAEAAPKVHPLAEVVMAEAGVDISDQRPKLVSDVPVDEIDTIIFLDRQIFLGLPMGLREEAWELLGTQDLSSDAPDAVMVFRRIRDELRRCIEDLIH